MADDAQAPLMESRGADVQDDTFEGLGDLFEIANAEREGFVELFEQAEADGQATEAPRVHFGHEMREQQTPEPAATDAENPRDISTSPATRNKRTEQTLAKRIRNIHRQEREDLPVQDFDGLDELPAATVPESDPDEDTTDIRKLLAMSDTQRGKHIDKIAQTNESMAEALEQEIEDWRPNMAVETQDVKKMLLRVMEGQKVTTKDDAHYLLGECRKYDENPALLKNMDQTDRLQFFHQLLQRRVANPLDLETRVRAVMHYYLLAFANLTGYFFEQTVSGQLHPVLRRPGGTTVEQYRGALERIDEQADKEKKDPNDLMWYARYDFECEDIVRTNVEYPKIGAAGKKEVFNFGQSESGLTNNGKQIKTPSKHSHLDPMLDKCIIKLLKVPTYQGRITKDKIREHVDEYFTWFNARGNMTPNNPMRDYTEDEMGLPVGLKNYLDNNLRGRAADGSEPFKSATGLSRQRAAPAKIQPRDAKGRIQKHAAIPSDTTGNPADDVGQRTVNELPWKMALLNAINAGQVTAAQLGMQRLGTVWKTMQAGAATVFLREKQILQWATDQGQKIQDQIRCATWYRQVWGKFAREAGEKLEQYDAFFKIPEVQKVLSTLPQEIQAKIPVQKIEAVKLPPKKWRRQHDGVDRRKSKSRVAHGDLKRRTPTLPLGTESKWTVINKGVYEKGTSPENTVDRDATIPLVINDDDDGDDDDVAEAAPTTKKRTSSKTSTASTSIKKPPKKPKKSSARVTDE